MLKFESTTEKKLYVCKDRRFPAIEMKTFHLLKFVITNVTLSEDVYLHWYAFHGELGRFYFQDKYA